MRRTTTAAFAALALACTTASAEKPLAEASMLVTGTIELNTDGTVHGYTLDKSEKLPPPVVQLLQQNVPSWKFQFSKSPAGLTKESMSARIVATDTSDGRIQLTLKGVQLDDVGGSSEVVTSLARPAPNFPPTSLHAGVSGTVYLLLRIDRDGKVADVATEQVNLHQNVPKNSMPMYRNDLSKAAERAARHWTYAIPTSGKWAQSPSFLVRVPVLFHIMNPGMDQHSGENYGT